MTFKRFIGPGFRVLGGGLGVFGGVWGGLGVFGGVRGGLGGFRVQDLGFMVQGSGRKLRSGGKFRGQTY